VNAAVKDFASDGQFLKIDTKEEYQMNDKLEDFVEDIQSLWTVNLEDNQDKEGWLIIDAEEKDKETCAEFLEEIPSEMEDLWHELSLLENRLENQRMSIQTIQLELSGDEEVVINDKSEEEAVKKL